MTDSRTRILERIGRVTGGGPEAADDIEAAFKAACQTTEISPLPPEMGMTDPVAAFAAEASRNGAKVTHLENLTDVAQWLEQSAREAPELPTLHPSPQIPENALPKQGMALAGPTPAASGSWGLVRAHTAIAETGTIMSLSGECPSGLLFLVERLIVIIARADIVDYQEAAWQRLRAEQALPRTVNWITGPSRTADIEQQIQIGVHGPRQTDYLIIENDKA